MFKVKALQTSKHSVTMCHIPEDLNSQLICMSLPYNYQKGIFCTHKHIHTQFLKLIYWLHSLYIRFSSQQSFVVMELGDEMTAVIFRQELLVGKGGKSYVSSGVACERVDCTCICNVNTEVEVYEEQTREFNTLTLVRCFKVSERK